MKKILFLLLLIINTSVFAQSTDESTVKSIFDNALRDGKSYEMLHHLSTKVGSRLSGSPGAAAAVEWSRHVMQDFGFDSVWLQPVLVPHWVRGQQEIGRVINSKKMGTVSVNVCALGGSIGTGPDGVVSKVIEVKSFEELAQLGSKNVQGKIVFFNRPMDPTYMDTFAASDAPLPL